MKLILPKVTGIGATSVINSNFAKIATELQNEVLYRKNPIGEPNALETPIDANNQDITNVKDLRADRLFVDGVEIVGGLGGGLVGPVGPAGPAGATGLPGATGATGPSGPASTIGPQGPAGVTGSQGPIGPSGAAGTAGSNGTSGAVGPQGPQGPQGLTGATGATGPAGANGAASTVAGPSGSQGLTGAVGGVGPVGPQGPAAPIEKIQTLTVASPIAWDVANGAVAKVTLTSSTAMGFPTNLKVGVHLLIVDQDATGARVLTFPAPYKLLDSAASTVANTRAIYLLVSDGSEVMVTVYRQGMVLAAPAPVNTFPAKVVATYYESYYYGANTFSIELLSPLFNVLYLFNAVPSNLQPGNVAPATGQNRINYGTGAFTWFDAGAPHCTAAKIQQLRATGCKVLITVGGAGAGYNFSTRAKSDAFIASFDTIYNQTGGIDGCDFNNFEGGIGSNPTEMIYIAQRLKALYGGDNFAITCPPAPDAVNAPTDRTLTKAMSDAGVLTYAAPQFYDASFFKGAGIVKGYIDQWVAHIGTPRKIIAGLSSNYDGYNELPDSFGKALTQAETEREVTAFLAAHPTLRGVYFWTAKSARDENNVTVISVKNKLDAAGTPIAPSDQALSVAMEGQVGAWYDAAPANLRQPNGTAVTTPAQSVGSFIDRSIGAENGIITAPDESFYRLVNGFSFVESYGRFKNATGAGTGASPTTGFFLCTAVQVTSTFPFVYSDGNTTTNGRHILFDSSTGKFVFNVGTATGVVQITSPVLSAPNVVPTEKMVIKAWQDATNIYLQINGGIVSSTPCAVPATPTINYFAICGSNVAAPGFSALNIYYHFHTLSPLDQTKRDNVAAYISGRIG